MERLTRTPAILVVSCAVAVSLACSRSRAKDAGQRVRIAVGGQTQLIYLPATLAQELGFYRDEGLDVELQDHAGGAKALQALVGGSADVVCGFYDHTIQMAADGRALVAFVTMLRYPGLLLVTSPQSAASVTTIEQLKGKIAGVTTMGSSSHMLLTAMLARHGVAPDAVSVTGIGSAATSIAALERGKVDAGMVADPAFTLLARRAAGVRVLADLRNAEGVHAAFGVSAYPGSVLYASADWIAAHHDETARLARAIRRTLEWMHAHTAQEIAEKTPAAFRLEENEVYVEALANTMSMFSTDGVMTPEGAATVRTVLAASIEKVRTATIDLSKTYTNAFVQQR